MTRMNRMKMTSLPRGRPGSSGWSRFTAGALLLIPLISLACQEPPARAPLGFPPDFLWGAAVAGFQVDPGCPTMDASICVDSRSDWFVWVTTPELIDDPSTHLSGEPLSHGPGHWELYEQDYDLAAEELGLNAFRLSVEWSRIFPYSTEGIEDPTDLLAVASAENLAHYRAELEALRSRGIQPLVTLNHYTLPVWIHDALGCHRDLDHCSPRGWLDRETIVHEIAKYAGFVAGALGDLVDLWATENEPFAVVLAGYLQPGPDRTNPPGVSLAFDEVKAVSLAMIEAHARMVDAVRQADTIDANGDGLAAQVGLVFAVAPAHPADPDSPVDQQAAENVNYLYNWAFLDAVVKGSLDASLLGSPTQRADLADRMDFLGINYYAVTRVQGEEWATLPALSPLTTFNPLSLEVDYDAPSGIYEALVLVADRYPGLPLYITENGTPHVQDGVTQQAYLTRHLTWVSRAWQDGVDVRGYFYWSFMDNYEWNHGTSMRFGLYAVDPLDPDKTRTPRPVVADYARIIGGNRIPGDLAAEWPVP